MVYPTSNANLNTSFSGSSAQSGVHAPHHDALATEVNAIEADLLPGGALRATIDGKAPALHHANHEPGGSDPMAVDAVAATGSLRTLGTGAQQAAAGNHTHTTVIPAALKAASGVVTGIYTLVRIPADRAGTVQKIQAIAVGGTSVAFNFRKNGLTLLHTGDITVTSGTGWTAVTTALINTAIAADDYLELLVNTVTGAVTDLTAQIEVK